MGMKITTINSCTVASDIRHDMQTASVSLWLQNGARYEKETEHGFAHFLEHLVFKQTRQRSGKELSTRFEIMGGHVNAETGRELTAFHGLVPKHHAIDLLNLFIEMLTEPNFTHQDFMIERDVVLQELAMLNDDPEEALEDYATEQVWANHSMGQQILGSRHSLNNSQYDDMVRYLDTINKSRRLCIVTTGNVDHEAICSACEKLDARSDSSHTATHTPTFTTTTSRLVISAEQKHMTWVMPAAAYHDHNQPAYEISNHILAGGYDSRLYQALREQLGLVYSIDSRIDYYSDTGLWFIQTNTEKENSDETIRALEKTVLDLINNGPTEMEMQYARQHLQSSLLVEQDDLETHMDTMARDIFYTGKVISVDERLEKLQQVSAHDVTSVLKKSWQNTSHFTAG